MKLEPELVAELEAILEEAIAKSLQKVETERLPMRPGRTTIHLMAKAAVTVFETAVANRR